MVKRMLIDAAHPEESRVVVINGTRLEEFDVETSTKKQLKGNIYLAKVTRVEPSLQAAFVDYGGNRHGFLAFSEIHPDYYQIPVEDREALETPSAPETQDEDENNDNRRRRPRRSRRSRSRDEKPVIDAEVVEVEAPQAEPETPSEAAAEAPSVPVAEEPAAASVEEAAPAPVEAAEEEAAAPVEADVPADSSEANSVEAPLPQAEPDQEAPVEAASDETPAEEGDTAAEEGKDGSIAMAAETPELEVDVPVSDEAVAAEPAADAPAQPDEAEEGDASSEEEDAEAEARDRESEEDEVEDLGGDDPEEIAETTRPRFNKRYKIQEVIKRRQIMLVQVVKEERGNKGAALSTYLSLAGRYCVLMPNTPRGGGISRKISSAKDRKRLKGILAEMDIPEGMAVIVRTAGAERSRTEIKRDCDYLLRLWDRIRETTLQSQAPCLIYEEANLIKRSIRDLYASDIDEVMVEGDEGFRIAKDFMKMLMPSHGKRVQPYRDAVPLFQRYQIESQLDAMHVPEVQLRSGGYLVINPTEALVAIDVNSGKATKERNIEETALRTNIEAAEEVARQLRLRDLAGLVVIDFIDMEETRNQITVERKLKEAMRTDRARLQIGRISPFGLLELSRQRLRPSIMESSFDVCPHCKGTGLIRSIESSALYILRMIEDEGAKRRSSAITLTVHTQIALYILNNKRDSLMAIEARYGLSVSLDGDDHLVPPEFRIDRTKASRDDRPKIEKEAIVSVGSVLPDYEYVDEADEEPEEEVEAKTETEEREESDTRGRGRGRRNRNRGRARDKRAEEPVEAAATDEDDDEDEDGNARRRRRRGKRGGRRRGRREDAVEGENNEEYSDADRMRRNRPHAAPLVEETETAETDADTSGEETAEEDAMFTGVRIGRRRATTAPAAPEPEERPRHRRGRERARERDRDEERGGRRRGRRDRLDRRDRRRGRNRRPETETDNNDQAQNPVTVTEIPIQTGTPQPEVASAPEPVVEAVEVAEAPVVEPARPAPLYGSGVVSTPSEPVADAPVVEAEQPVAAEAVEVEVEVEPEAPVAEEAARPAPLYGAASVPETVQVAEEPARPAPVYGSAVGTAPAEPTVEAEEPVIETAPSAPVGEAPRPAPLYGAAAAEKPAEPKEEPTEEPVASKAPAPVAETETPVEAEPTPSVEDAPAEEEAPRPSPTYGSAAVTAPVEATDEAPKPKKRGWWSK